MARTTRKNPNAPVASQHVQEAIQRIVELIGPERVFAVSGMPTLTRMFKDGSYKKGHHIEGEEFALLRGYQGKRGSAIFVFEPVDARDFETVEVSAGEIGEVFPAFQSKLIEVAGWSGPHSAWNFPYLIKWFAEQIEAAAHSAVVSAEANRARTMQEKYGHLPHFGKFA